MYLFGAGGHCKVVIDIILASKVHKIESVIDHNPKSDCIFDIPIVNFNQFTNDDGQYFIVSIGDNKKRKRVVELIKAVFVNAIHPSAIISRFAKVSEGTVVMAGAIINANTIVGKHCIINTGAIIDHDCIIEDFVHVSPNVSVAGNVTIGEGAHLGIGVTVIQGITIGKWAVLGAGAVIIENVPDYAVVVGVPGKIIKFSNKNE
ncbi:acetyltransferase [Flavobacterium nackdongense]|uniref:Acetyltransferase n=1 Tax=Flavobacterium nackdongense TaxID=2547394 RepID=A0A4V1AH02_9FLAO|nr:acetyltransferase [Flavobacterium nackdongense]QBN19832.1 acetyltransferase [Flavobacterium nackdongense]